MRRRGNAKEEAERQGLRLAFAGAQMTCLVSKAEADGRDKRSYGPIQGGAIDSAKGMESCLTKRKKEKGQSTTFLFGCTAGAARLLSDGPASKATVQLSKQKALVVAQEERMHVSLEDLHLCRKE